MMRFKMPQGKVKEYDSDRGYGSIIDSETGQQITVYANYIRLQDRNNLKKGQDVWYETEKNRHENWAINVRISEKT